MGYDGCIVVIDELQRSNELLREFQEHLAAFDGSLCRLQELKTYSGNEWMLGHYNPSIVESHGQEAIEVLAGSREEIAKRIDDVTVILAHYHLPYEWKVYPPPAFGGLIRSFNALQAFIDLEIEDSARPTLLQVTDLVSKAIWRCEKEIEQESNKKFDPVEKVAVASHVVGSLVGWFFPSEKQRAILGWLILVAFGCLILRYAFGLHVEEIGKLIVKWVFK